MSNKQTHWTLALQYARKAKQATIAGEREWYERTAAAYKATALRLLAEGHPEALAHYPHAKASA